MLDLHEKEVYDLSLAINLLNYVENDTEALTNMYHALKKPGILIIFNSSNYADDKASKLNIGVYKDLDELNNDEIPQIADDYIEEILSLKYDDKLVDKKDLEETTNPSTSELKTITLDLGDNDHDKIEYKKLSKIEEITQYDIYNAIQDYIYKNKQIPKNDNIIIAT